MNKSNRINNLVRNNKHIEYLNDILSGVLVASRILIG